MTEVESMELVATFTANASTNFTIFISFTFAFLATAYFVGSKLSKFQSFSAASLYTVAAGSAAISCIAWLQAFNTLMESSNTLLNSLPLFASELWVSGMSVLFVAGIAMSLYFMWSVRHPKTE